MKSTNGAIPRITGNRRHALRTADFAIRLTLICCMALLNHEVLESSEAFEEKNGDLEFSHTKVILRRNNEYFYAITNSRYRRNCKIDPLTLECIPIPSSKIWPQFPVGFTRVAEAQLEHCFIKRPSLLYYGDTQASTEISTLLLQEARICEILRTSPHINIAKYLGCLVEGGMITGLCFVRYQSTLTQLMKSHQSFDKAACLNDIQMGIEHLHKLGLIHCDLNPDNILIDGEHFVIGDFDSCTPELSELGLKAGTRGWADLDSSIATRENDLLGFSKIQDYLLESQVV